VPWLKAAVDEYTVDTLGGELPEDYQKALANTANRELIINIPEKAVRDLFIPPHVVGKITEVK